MSADLETRSTGTRTRTNHLLQHVLKFIHELDYFGEASLETLRTELRKQKQNVRPYGDVTLKGSNRV